MDQVTQYWSPFIAAQLKKRVQREVIQRKPQLLVARNAFFDVMNDS
jgi:hypothetical protein